MSKFFNSQLLQKVLDLAKKKENQDLVKGALSSLTGLFKTNETPVKELSIPSTPHPAIKDDIVKDGRRKPVKRKKTKKLWDIPGISSVDKAEIMRIVSETEKIKQDTDDQIRMLIPDYKKPKPPPVKRTRPSVSIDPSVRPPPPKRRPIPTPVQDVEDDVRYDRPLPPIPREERPLPPIPIEERPLPPIPMEDEELPPEPDEPAPEIPMDVQDISVPVGPAPPPPPRTIAPYRRGNPSLLDQIHEGVSLRHVEDSRPPPTPRRNDGLAQILQRRIYVAPPDDDNDNDSGEWDGYGRSRGFAYRAGGQAFVDPESLKRWRRSWGAYI